MIETKQTTKERFLDLATKLEAAKDAYKAIQDELNEVMTEIGQGQYIQDANTKLVYKICTPKGTFVAYKAIDYVRTKKPTEDRGDLSVKEAEAAGFTIK